MVPVTFAELIQQTVKEPFEGKLLALDPGETTGYAVFQGTEMLDSGQIITKDIETGLPALMDLINSVAPDFLVYETYRVYGWKTKDHAFSDLHTSQFIGTIKALCLMKRLSYHGQSAQVAKGFCTDDKLKQWGFWIKGKKHACDAVRHGIYFLAFNTKHIPQPIEETNNE